MDQVDDMTNILRHYNYKKELARLRVTISNKVDEYLLQRFMNAF